MVKKIVNQVSFINGELSPLIYGHSDVDEYKRGLETATNAVVYPHGPIARRNGSQFISEIKDSTSTARLIDFQISDTVAYILEFGNLYLRFYSNASPVLESDLTITAITQANPGVITSTAHGLANGDQVYIQDVLGMTEINDSVFPYIVAGVTANTFTVTTLAGAAVDTTAFTAYTSGGVINRIYTITSPYTISQVDDIAIAKYGDTMYIAHPDVAPYQLSITSATSWTLAAMDLLPPPTYESGYLNTGVTITPAATTGTGINFTASGALFLNGDVGRQIINDSGTGRASITSVTSTTVVVCDIIEDFPSTAAIASADWQLDLSPVVNLEIDATQSGVIANIRSEYTTGSLGPRFSITAVTKASPGVVTTSASHGYANGDKIQIQDIIGMTEINDKIFTVAGVTATTFQLKGEDTTGYTTYSSGGIVRKKLDDLANDAFRAADVGKYIRMNGGVLQIISVNSATDVDAEIIKSLNEITTTGNWTLEVPTWDATRGYPRIVGLYEQRLVFGGTDAQPQTIWISEIAIFDGFGIGPDDEDSIEIDLVAGEINTLSWMQATRDLVIGTSGGELTINSGTSSSSITPSANKQQPRTPYGSTRQKVAAVGEEILFIQNSDRKIRTFRYDFNLDGYTGEELTFLAEHITEGVLVELIYAQEPKSIIYAVLEDGAMLAGTYDRIKRVIAWTRFETDGYYERVQSVTRNAKDEIWVIVKRLVNGVTKRYIEIFDNSTGEVDTDSFSDSYLTLSTPLTITGITQASPAVVTSTAHGLSNGDSVVIKGVVDPLAADLDATKTNMSSINQSIFTIAGVTANTFELGTLDTTAYNAYSSGGFAYERVTSLSGLDHLEGKTVQVKGDGGVQATQVVTSGSITADTAAGEFVIGLPYITTIKTLNIEFDLGIGSMQGQLVKWVRPLIRVYKSGIPTVNSQFLPVRNAADLMGQKVPLFSGFLEYGTLGWDTTSALTVSLSDPLPLVIQSITGTIDSGVK